MRGSPTCRAFAPLGGVGGWKNRCPVPVKKNHREMRGALRGSGASVRHRPAAGIRACHGRARAASGPGGGAALPGPRRDAEPGVPRCPAPGRRELPAPSGARTARAGGGSSGTPPRGMALARSRARPQGARRPGLSRRSGAGGAAPVPQPLTQ